MIHCQQHQSRKGSNEWIIITKRERERDTEVVLVGTDLFLQEVVIPLLLGTLGLLLFRAMARRKRKTKAAFVTTSQTPTADVASSTEATTATTNKPVVATDHRSTSITTVLDDYLPVEPGMEDLSTARVLLMGAALLAVGTFGFYYIPGLMITPPNKDVVDSTNGNHHHHHHHHLIHAFYCASITLTT
eukprot:scaffold45927_cov176-Amphora_coffeaeformis.AAC.1